jgi:hypothetical protein
MSFLPSSWSRRALTITVLASSAVVLFLLLRHTGKPDLDDLEAGDEMMPIYERYPLLRHVQKDLIAGKTDLARAVEMTAPLVEGRLREAVIYRGGTVEKGVAMMLVAWIEQQAADEPGSVPPELLRRLQRQLEAMPEVAKGPEHVPMKG